MRVLVVTSEWPDQEYPNAGIFVASQVDAMRQVGIKIDVLHFRGRRNPFNYLKAVVKMHRSLSMNSYDLIHAHFGQAGLISVLQNRVPVVVTFHGSDLYGLEPIGFIEKLWSAVLRLVSIVAAKRATEVIAVSERIAELLPSRSHHVIPMGLNLALFRPMEVGKARKYLGWPKTERFVLFVGNPRNKIKRYELAVEAVAMACKKIPNIQLQCCYNEVIDHMPFYINASDVLLVTSLHESGPLVVREALACNLPVVSVDVGDVRQRISKVNGCIVCENEKAETISEALIKVLESDAEVNARDTLLDLKEGKISEKVLDVYALALRQ